MQTDKKVWALDGDPQTRDAYQEIFRFRYQIETFSSLRSLTDQFQKLESKPHLLIADLKVSDGNFLDFLDEGAFLTQEVPFVIISSLDDLDVLRACFKKGALDYLTKPFRRAEIVVKIERILSCLKVHEVSEGSKILLNPMTLTISGSRNEAIQLTTKEYHIFSLLYRSRERLMSRRSLQREVWGNMSVSEKSLDVHILNLRKKLIMAGLKISFVPPGSFRLEESGGCEMAALGSMDPKDQVG